MDSLCTAGQVPPCLIACNNWVLTVHHVIYGIEHYLGFAVLLLDRKLTLMEGTVCLMNLKVTSGQNDQTRSIKNANK